MKSFAKDKNDDKKNILNFDKAIIRQFQTFWIHSGILSVINSATVDQSAWLYESPTQQQLLNWRKSRELFLHPTSYSSKL